MTDQIEKKKIILEVRENGTTTMEYITNPMTTPHQIELKSEIMKILDKRFDAEKHFLQELEAADEILTWHHQAMKQEIRKVCEGLKRKFIHGVNHEPEGCGCGECSGIRHYNQSLDDIMLALEGDVK